MKPLAVVFTVVALVFTAACGGKSSPQPTAGPGPGAGTTDGSAAACVATGCSGTVCSDQEVMSTCEYKPEYACYKTATCARQADGNCGWTQTPELTACLANPPPMQ